MLDIRTFIFVLACSDLATAGIVFAYWTEHHRDRLLGLFIVSKFLLAFSWFAFLFWDDSSGKVLLMAIISLLFIGGNLEVVSFLKLIDHFKPLTRKFYFILAATGLIIFSLLLLVESRIEWSIVYLAIGMGALLPVPTRCFFQKRHESRLIHVIAYLFLSIVLISITLLLMIILQQMSMIAVSSRFIQILALIGIYLSVFLSNTGFVMIKNDRMDKELARRANYDDLTQALNRQAFFERTAGYLHRQLLRSRSVVSFLLFDIDNFKNVNDQYGHDAGDRVLRDLSNRVYGILEKKMVFGRFGGDEFCLLLPGANEEQSDAFAELLRRTIAEARVSLKTGELGYSISVGLLTLLKPDVRATAESLYVACDIALYAAKRKGKNNVYRGNYQTESDHDPSEDRKKRLERD